MNGANRRSYFQIPQFARVSLQSWASATCKLLAWLLAMVLAGPALALVGPAQEAPEFAPYAVMVMTRSGGATNFCTASVIARNVVLTAAHCVTDISDTKVFFRASESKLALFDVAAIAAHPEYKPSSRRKRQNSLDLALVRLSEPLPSEFIPLELARLDHVSIGQRFRILGFGRASEDVSGTSGVLRAGVLAVGGLESPLLVKLVDPDGTGLGGCTGDSGGPILSINRLALAAVAIQAKGQGGYSCGAATRAVLIGPLMPWIRDTLRSWGAAWSMMQ
jgi:hypothetical protein